MVFERSERATNGRPGHDYCKVFGAAAAAATGPLPCPFPGEFPAFTFFACSACCCCCCCFDVCRGLAWPGFAWPGEGRPPGSRGGMKGWWVSDDTTQPLNPRPLV